MPIVVTLDIMLATRKAKSKDLADYVGITEANVSLLKQGKVKGVRFETLEAICRFLDCQPGDILKFVPDGLEEAPNPSHQSSPLIPAKAGTQAFSEAQKARPKPGPRRPPG